MDHFEDDLPLDERLAITLEFSPRFRELLGSAFKTPFDEWDDEYATTALRAAFGFGVSAACNEPELLAELRRLGFRIKV